MSLEEFEPNCVENGSMGALKLSLLGIGAIVGVLLLVLAIGWLVGSVAGPFELRGSGPGVAHLSEGARVVLGTTEVGKVEDLRLESGEQVAVLLLDRELRGNMGKRTRFVVTSINDWIPGNVGVRIFPADSGDTDALESGDTVTLETTTLVKIPAGFWVALGILCAVLGLTLALAKVLHSILVFMIGVAVLVFLASYFLTSVAAA